MLSIACCTDFPIQYIGALIVFVECGCLLFYLPIVQCYVLHIELTIELFWKKGVRMNEKEGDGRVFMLVREYAVHLLRYKFVLPLN